MVNYGSSDSLSDSSGSWLGGRCSLMVESDSQLNFRCVGGFSQWFAGFLGTYSIVCTYVV